jgi:hypothetical protein
VTMWILILIVSNLSVAIATVPNYASKEACEIAGKAAQEGFGKTFIHYRCIPAP